MNLAQVETELDMIVEGEQVAKEVEVAGLFIRRIGTGLKLSVFLVGMFP